MWNWFLESKPEPLETQSMLGTGRKDPVINTPEDSLKK